MATLVNKMNREVKVIIPNMREFRVFYSDNEGSVMFFKRDWEEVRGEQERWKPTEEQMEKEEDGWYLMPEAKERLNAMELGISFFGNLFSYLRKRGKLDGLCKLGRRGAQRVWLYDVMGIAEKVKKGELKYKQRYG